ncbi:myosin-9 isoform X1 [Acyrthosiphon pisum]|uniref:PHD finger protein 10 n=2 Tax=Acyrthosiphon pisum TaxID=7029 RepID=A0A8R2A114_ACYPI|nr:myosin-9 isoform X1 [Acyrthosiphon pisum]|eukprot:XP_001947369.2 PREDICTED: myosin-9 isoform X1 [Acyrthosiphon pisum]
MEEEKIAADASDKRKVEDDNINPKPNPKRIKLVRPVFSPVAKPSISTTSEVNKSDVPPTDIPKSNIQPTETPKSTAQATEVPKTTVQQSEIHTINLKPTELPKFNNNSGSKVSTTADVSLSTEKLVDRLEIVKSNISSSETIKKPVVTTLQVSDEQVDSSSDALDIKNIFSEETKKELEHLKKNIFKIDDDGSSSENDSQPKRPRLKRPTFVTSTVEVKIEPTDSKINDKINETSRLEPLKSVCEENINITVKKSSENLSSVEENIDQITENITEDVRLKQVEQVNITENIIKVEEEKSTAFKSVVKLVENKTGVPKSVEKSTEVDNLRDVDKIKSIQTATNIQKNTDVKETILAEKKTIDKKKVNLTAEEQKCIKKEKPSEENALSKGSYEKDIDYNAIKESANDHYRVILERLVVDKQSNFIIQDKNPSPIVVKLEDDKSIVESSYECTDKYNIIKNKIDIHDEIKNELFDSQLHNTQKDNDVTYLESKNLNSKKNTYVENENKLPNTLSKEVPANDIRQKNEETDSQMFKSDILKAALMSKKSPESLGNSSEVCDQSSVIEYSTMVESKQNENLPTIGEDSIVNKIEAEIKLAIKDQPAKIKKPQNKIVSNIPEMSKEACSSICLNENATVGKHDEPPKWGSAKMNEVEKFLNDSNVTITPICKSQESPKLGKITLKLPKVGNPEIKSETTVRPDVKSELIKKITNKHIAMGDSPLKNALSQPSKSFTEFATIRPAPKLSAEQIALLEQQILNTPKKRGRPSKALAQQKQLLLEYQQQQQSKVQEGSTEDEPVFHVPLFDMEDMSGGAGMFDSFEASTPKRGKSIRGKGSRGRRGRGGRGGRGRDGSDSDTASNSRRVDDEGETFHEEMNQEEETKQVAMIEAERLRKEEERERKLEARKKKIKLRNDILKEKKMKKKQRAEERRLQWHEKKRLMQEEKARAAEMKKSLPPPQNFDDETRMSADCNNSLSQTTARNFILGEEDLSISGTTNDSIRMKKGRMEVIDLESNKTLTVDQIAEYQWPLDGGELYMIQEQISNFLGVKSFKRKYPGLKRRNVEAEERTFLCDSGLVAESLCDLGLTVLYSSEVLDIMYTDFPEKYEELREYMRLKHAKELSNRQRALMTISSNNDGSKLDLRDRAMEAVANWNANLNKSRLESRKCSMDMQTFIVHYPKNKCKKMAVPKPKIGSYPLALLPGQFCDYYATYSSEDLRYLPMNTVMYGPLKSVDKDFPVSLSSQSESEDSSSDDSSDSDDSIDNDNKSDKNCLEYGPSDKKGAECKLCLGTADKNKIGSVEPLIHCSKCLTIYHPTCLDMTLEMVPYIKRYNWQCNECKSCAQCKEVADEDKMLFCDLCDRGYHIYCVGLRRVPEGRWHCQECAMCSSCGVSDPGPGDSKWFYEFKKTEKTGSKVYCRTLCAPCSRSWKKGHFCPNCMRCYPIKNVERMTQCNSCDRYLHSECISESTSVNQVVTCTICEEKAVSRLLTTVPRSLIKV